MDVRVGDVLVMKKTHPCGGAEFLVERIGADFRVKCLKCDREIMIERARAEGKIKKIVRGGSE